LKCFLPHLYGVLYRFFLSGAHCRLPVFVFFRVLFAFPFMFFYSIKRFGFKELLKAKPILPLILSGIVLSLNWIFFFWAINITDIATAVVLYYFGPVFTIILAVIFLKEPLNKTLVFAIIVAFAGAFLTFAPSIKPGGFCFWCFYCFDFRPFIRSFGVYFEDSHI